jgi:hypothetical protein
MRDDKPFVLFCFDEARALLEPSDMSFISLRRALRHQSMPRGTRGEKTDKENFFAVLLDTSAKVSTFSPPRELDRSAKFGLYEKQFLPIWQIDSYDVFAQGKHTITPLSIDIDVRRLFSLGRPNWGARLRTGNIMELMNYAQTKAFGGGSTKGITEITDDTLTALLSYRMQFYVVSHHLSETLVSGYLRMVRRISDDHRLIHTIHPSEPILAHVATELMRKKPEIRLRVLQKFHHHCAHGSIDIGDIGEMVAALIFLFSFDRKHGEQFEEGNQHAQPNPSPIGLYHFLESMFGKKFVSGLGKYIDDDMAINRMMTKGFVFFNHFARLEGRVDQTVLRQAWGRGVALFTYAGTAYFDIVIPVAIVDADLITYLIVQVKNRQDDHLGSAAMVEADYAISRAASSLPKVPACLGIFMALRCKGNPGLQVAHPTEQYKMRLRSGKRENQYKWSDPKRLVLAAVGLDDSIYPGIAPTNDQLAKGIWQTLRDLLDLQCGIRIEHASPYMKNMAVGYAEG